MALPPVPQPLGREDMLRKNSIIASFFVAALLLLPAKSWSQGLPEGITVSVVAEHPVNIPGIEKVTLLKFTFQPGAVLENFLLEATEFCNATQGSFTVVNHDLGTTTVYTAGSRWSQGKGQTVTVSNTGEEVAVQWVYELIESG